MSVQQNSYIVVGAKFPFPQFGEDYDAEEAWHDKCEPYLDSPFKSAIVEHNGLSVFKDGMNGNWVIIGKCLAKTGNYDGFGDVVHLDGAVQEAIDGEWDGIASLITDKFGYVDPDISLMVFTHYR